MGTGSEQIPAGIARKTVAARCLPLFPRRLAFTVRKKGTGTVGKRKTPAEPDSDGASPRFRTPVFSLS